MPEVMSPAGARSFKTRPWVATLFICLLMILSASPLRAADLELNISQKAVQNFFNAALPYRLNYQPMPGAMAADIVISNPRVVLEPGRPGHFFVEVDYQGESKLLGIAPFTGTSRPEVLFTFAPKRSALRLQLSDLRIKAGEKLKFNLDGIIEPLYLPLAPGQGVEMGEDQVLVKPGNVKTEVTNRGLRLSVDYGFERRRVPEQSPKQ